jgi:hypothetical protein
MPQIKRNRERSLEQLISALEHIEESELQSDIPANVRAELKRMKRNISAILTFVSHAPRVESAATPELRAAMNEVRRNCLFINGMISKTLLLQALQLGPARIAAYTSRAMAKYAEMMQSAHEMCLIAAPPRAQELLNAL